MRRVYLDEGDDVECLVYQSVDQLDHPLSVHSPPSSSQLWTRIRLGIPVSRHSGWLQFWHIRRFSARLAGDVLGQEVSLEWKT